MLKTWPFSQEFDAYYFHHSIFPLNCSAAISCDTCSWAWALKKFKVALLCSGNCFYFYLCPNTTFVSLIETGDGEICKYWKALPVMLKITQTHVIVVWTGIYHRTLKYLPGRSFLSLWIYICISTCICMDFQIHMQKNYVRAYK